MINQSDSLIKFEQPHTNLQSKGSNSFKNKQPNQLVRYIVIQIQC